MTTSRSASQPQSLLSIFAVFLKLGLTSFGGPIAHLGYLRAELVERRKWLDDKAYADLVALCQFLPGPSSSQVGFALGVSRRGVPGGVMAWLGFTLPSALIMIAFAYGISLWQGLSESGWMHGLQIAAVAVVAQAVWSMGRQLCPDRTRASLAVGSAWLLLAWPSPIAQVCAIGAAALLGWALLEPDKPSVIETRFPGSRHVAEIAWVLFVGLLILLPITARTTGNYVVTLFDEFYRSGSLVFGGGHVVLPLLRAEVVPAGWVSDSDFLAGYGLAQALPGPLFTFAAYLGAVSNHHPNGWIGGCVALCAIFLPGLLLVLGTLPYWKEWRRKPAVRAAMDGVNAAVVGILLAALYDPIFVSAVKSRLDFALALVAFALLVFWRLSPVWVVGAATLAGGLMAFSAP